jgi:hypothetical protein
MPTTDDKREASDPKALVSNARSLSRWCTDPDHCSTEHRTPLVERLCDAIEQLIDEKASAQKARNELIDICDKYRDNALACEAEAVRLRERVADLREAIETQNFYKIMDALADDDAKAKP